MILICFSSFLWIQKENIYQVHGILWMFLPFYYILLDLLQDFLLLNHFLLHQSMSLSNRDIFKNDFFRIFLCLDLIIWYVRILHIFAAYEKLGPKLIMILNTVCI